jgi:hypothetical protein
VNYGRQRAAALLTAAAEAVQPGGSVAGATVLGLDARANGEFILYLCSGEARNGDFSSWVSQLSAAQVYVVNVDVLRGGYADDISAPPVLARLMELASDRRCRGVLATIPCSTWSPARFVQPGPKPLRSLAEPEGFRDADGQLPPAVAKANAIARNAIALADAAAAHGGQFIFENPVGRDRTSQFAIAGREDHASLWKLPAMVDFARRHGENVVVFDQCRTNGSTQKTTQLLCSGAISQPVRERLGHLVCNHPPGTHGSIVGGDTSEGFRTKAAEQFTSELNRTLAECFLAPAVNASWAARAAALVETQTTRATHALATVMAESAIRLRVQADDATSLLSASADLYRELDDGDRAAAQPLMSEIAQIARGLGLEEAIGDLDALDDLHAVLAVSAVNRGSDDHPSYRRAMKGPEAQQWADACENEMASLRRHGIFEEVPEDSLESWCPRLRRSLEIVDILWVLKKKYNELRQLVKLKARATIRGDQESEVDRRMGLSAEETFAPTMRHNTFKLLTASSVCRAAQASASQGGAKSPLRIRSADVPVAFLNGASLSGRPRFVRPPEGYRTFDRRGVPIVWKMMGNCYGRAVAPRIWNKTFHAFLVDKVDGLGLTQSQHDPCYYFKVYADGSRFDCGIYVDDCWLCDNAGDKADVDVAKLVTKFDIKVDNTPRHFLGMNVTVESPTRVRITSEAYVLSMADKHVPTWRSWSRVELPSTERLTKAYESAHRRETPVPKELEKRYQGKVGACIYTSPCVRPDACYTISRLARAMTFATPELDACADETIVYLAQTAQLGVVYDGHAPQADTLRALSDSDWAIGHSTTGWLLMLAGACVFYASKRQACIAMSSTEAEIIAASACAVEAVHARALLTEMGLPQDSPTVLQVDNTGAVALARERRSCHRSRHVDRRYFKVRELMAEGALSVEHVNTNLNTADLLTKSLPHEPFARHRATALGDGAL